jgi:glycerophosphoryl diester phosphodiesterase
VNANPTFIGHRGARFEAPENTLPGFRYALDLGIQALEFDVHLTADEQLVVIHDDTVDRTTDGTGRVAELSLSEIQALDARSIFPDWPEPCFVPTLGQVLDTVSGTPDLIIEIKTDTPDRLSRIVPAVISEVENRDLTSQVTITSFDPVAVELVQATRSSIRHGWIGDWNTPEFLARSIELGCTQVDAHMPEADHAIVAQGKARGWRVVVWPCNTPEALDMALTYEPDLICTDEPSALRARYADLLASTR